MARVFRFEDHLSLAIQSGKIQDFGEKLGGARKDRATLDLKDYGDHELAAMPLSQIWPKSDIDKIEDNFIAALATVIRPVIPKKTRRRHHLSRWVEEVTSYIGLMRQAAEQLEQGAITKEDVVERLS